MRYLLVCLATSLVLAGCHAQHDLSDPKSAAYLLAVSIEQGDFDTARAVYIGAATFKRTIDGLEAVSDAADEFKRAIKHEYGPGMIPDTAGFIRLTVEKKPLLTQVALSEVVVAGDTAELKIPKGGSFIRGSFIRLQKIAGKWHVSDMPDFLPLHAFLDAASASMLQVAQEIRRGKYSKAYQARAALETIYADKVKVAIEAKGTTTKSVAQSGGS